MDIEFSGKISMFDLYILASKELIQYMRLKNRLPREKKLSNN